MSKFGIVAAIALGAVIGFVLPSRHSYAESDSATRMLLARNAEMLLKVYAEQRETNKLLRSIDCVARYRYSTRIMCKELPPAPADEQ